MLVLSLCLVTFLRVALAILSTTDEADLALVNSWLNNSPSPVHEDGDMYGNVKHADAEAQAAQRNPSPQRADEERLQPRRKQRKDKGQPWSETRRRDAQKAAEQGRQQRSERSDKGKPWSEARRQAFEQSQNKQELRDKISAARKGKPWSEARRQSAQKLIGQHRRNHGKPWSEAQRQAHESRSEERANLRVERISASRRGKPWSEKRWETERQMKVDERAAIRAEKVSRARLGVKMGPRRKAVRE